MLRGLIHGNVRGWGAIQYQQYARLLGNRHKVGIELEIAGKTNEEAVHKLIEKGFLFSRLDHNNGNPFYVALHYRTICRDEYEIQYLFDVRDPLSFYKEAQKVYNTCKQLSVPTYGSTHVNVQTRIDKVGNRDFKHNIIGDATKYVRVEYKKGPIWTNHKELLGGIITITSKRLDVAKYIDKIIKPKLLAMEELWEANFGIL